MEPATTETALPTSEGLPEDLVGRERIAGHLATAGDLRPVEVEVLAPPFERRGERGWLAKPRGLQSAVDGPSAYDSTVMLFEDGRPLGPAHAGHGQIEAEGGGAFSHWAGAVIFSTSDGSDPGSNGRQYLAVRTDWSLRRGDPRPRLLPGPYRHWGARAWAAILPGTAPWSDSQRVRPSSLHLYEDGIKLGPSNTFHLEEVRRLGRGAYTHWDDWLYFSTSDGTDPNANGRRYTVAGGPPPPANAVEANRREYVERHEAKREIWFRDPIGLWDLSPHASYFLERGGRDMPPPIYANLVGLTSFCNLKCTICGSQEAIDYEGIRRRSMRPEVMHAVADTIFPFLSVVILASLGEPTIYPWFDQVLEKCHQWGCSIKLESNATALTPRMIELLTSVKGELFFSIDATGALFEKVRRGANWGKVHQNLADLMAQRDPALTKMNMYPTISRRTLPDMLNVTKVAAELGFDELTFHSYDKTLLAKEERPTAEEFLPMEQAITEWLDGRAASHDMSRLSVKVNGREINPRFIQPTPLPSMPQNHPVKRSEYAANIWRCKAPRQNVDIGPDGEIYPCVWSGTRPQENTMGLATSKEQFAEMWFGTRYQELREALRHDSDKPINVAQCAACLERYA